MNKFILPSGKSIFHVNKSETEFVYEEIFLNKIYLKNGIKLDNDSCVFDIGANIGLFSMFIKEKFPNASIFSFEPYPALFEILKKNLTNIDSNIHLFDCGLGAKEGSLTFTYYPNYTIMSGFKKNLNRDKELLSISIKNQLGISDKNQSDRMSKFLVEDKLDDYKNSTCSIRKISSFIKEYNITKIDLLKIDAEKSELDIFEGLKSQHWKIIRQIIVEAHDEKIKNILIKLLKKRGYTIKSETEKNFEKTGVANIYAIKDNFL